MGGAGLIFDNLGLNMLSIVGRSNTTSVLYLNRIHGEEIKVELFPVDIHNIWLQEEGGVYALMNYVFERYGQLFDHEPRILTTGPASAITDFGAICSVPIQNGKLTAVDTWAGRGDFGSKILKQHNIAVVIYGGTFIDEDFRDRKVADQWFESKYQEKMAAKDIESTAKYCFEKNFGTGGTFGVNYATVKGSMLALNYRSIYMSEEERLSIYSEIYSKQFISGNLMKRLF